MRQSAKKKMRKTISVMILFAFFLSLFWNEIWIFGRAEDKTEYEVQNGLEVKPSDLYARSAVLMDAKTGRILFGKNKDEQMPMASTTKIMTCILALENGDLSEKVEVSSEAASQPAVKLGMSEGQSFYLKDLLYSLMLESHNDSAVAIAQSIAGDVSNFADMMNEKAKKLGCKSTYFITPNGLDGQDEKGIHHTTAGDLARIMKYCIMESEQKEKFLEITGTDVYTFTDYEGKNKYSCVNHNALLKMMDGALSGKTGFTANAGYCYVGALQKDDKTLIVALLACGWPNNKGYKWSDTRKLMNYGMENYFYREIHPQQLSQNETAFVKNGYIGGFPKKTEIPLEIKAEGKTKKILIGKDDKEESELKLKRHIKAPVEEGTVLGELIYRVNGKKIVEYQVVAEKSIKERTISVCLSYLCEKTLL